MRADVHMHSAFSSDSDSHPEEMILGAIEKGLEMLCFTDHYDKDNMDWGPEDIFEPGVYFEKMTEVREKYKDRIRIRIGVELGLQPHLGGYYEEFVKTLEEKPGFVRAMWCGDQACEDKIKEDTTATSRCMPFEQEKLSDTCICCKKPAKAMVYWGKAY